MICEQEKSELAVYALAALDTPDAERVGRHLQQCDACTTELDDIHHTLTSMQLVPEKDILGDWTGRIPDLREAAVRAALTTDRPTAPAAPAAPSPPQPLPTPATTRPRRRNWALAAALAGITLGYGTATLTNTTTNDDTPTTDTT
ncbi:hypothetical protein ACIOKD_27490, partial [Streptomyces sp. NPDC087844]